MCDESKMSVEAPSYLGLELVDFIAGANPEAVAGFRPSQKSLDRLVDLIEREKTEGLSADERAELDHFIELEHILRMAKAKARQILSSGV